MSATVRHSEKIHIFNDMNILNYYFFHVSHWVHIEAESLNFEDAGVLLNVQNVWARTKGQGQPDVLA